VIGAVDQVALVAKRYSENLGMLELRPDRIRETPNRRREYFVVSVFPVAIEPHPLASPLDQPISFERMYSLSLSTLMGMIRTAPRGVTIM
jgi:hypothetical protein